MRSVLFLNADIPFDLSEYYQVLSYSDSNLAAKEVYRPKAVITSDIHLVPFIRKTWADANCLLLVSNPHNLIKHYNTIHNTGVKTVGATPRDKALIVDALNTQIETVREVTAHCADSIHRWKELINGR